MTKMTSLSEKVTVTIFQVFLLVQSVDSDVVSMKMKLDNQNSVFTYINFYDKTFQQFYDCLTNNASQTCTAHLGSDTRVPHQNDDKYATSIDITTSSLSDVVNEYFTCKFDPIALKTTCTRQQINASACDTQILSQAFRFRLKNYLPNSHKCVGIIWNNLGEDLLFNNTASFEKCDPVCTSVKNGDNERNGHHSDVGKTDTIVGIVVTVALLIVATVLGVFLWKRSFANKATGSTEPICNSARSSQDLSIAESVGYANLGAELDRPIQIHPLSDRISLNSENTRVNYPIGNQVRTNNNSYAGKITSNTEEGLPTEIRNPSISSRHSIV